jgi:hypothetical protein
MIRPLIVLFVVVLASQLLCGCKADGVPNESSEKAEEASMEGDNRGLYASIESFVGKDWNGLGLFPDPCGQTPIQVPLPQSSFLLLQQLLRF